MKYCGTRFTIGEDVTVIGGEGRKEITLKLNITLKITILQEFVRGAKEILRKPKYI